jgi:hypothetical protein
VLEADEAVLRPEVVATFFAGDDFAETFEQDGQNFDGLAWKFSLSPSL